MPAPYDDETIERMHEVADLLVRMNVVLLAGGVGGAKMAEGLAASARRDLSIIVNTGDDLELHGLAVWPDHDTVAYTLADLDDQVRGWGLRDETWTVMDRLEALGAQEWFRLGDQDLATHLWRTDRLRAGGRPTEVALELGAAMGIESRILLMSDQPVRTEVLTDDGWLEFQEYFVHRHQEPTVRQVRFRGAESAQRDDRGPGGDRPRGRDRRRAIEPDRVDRPDPGGRRDPGRIAGGTCPRCPSGGGQRDRGREGAEGPGRPDARIAR